MKIVKENRSYIKTDSACININNTAYRTRLTKIAFNKNTDDRISQLESDIEELKNMLINNQEKNNGNHSS